MANHTQGPWLHYADVPSTDPKWHIVTTANKLRVVANVHIEPGNATDEANARLIAAAPDLLQTIVECRKQIDQIIEDGVPTDWRMWRDDLDALIAKAGA